MTSKKKTTAKKKMATKKKPKASALSPDQKLAIIEEAIERLPLAQSAGQYFESKSWPTFFRPATTWELMEFAKWWTRQGLDEVMQFATVRTATDYVWLLRWNYSTGQLAGELQIEHGVAAEPDKWCKFGTRIEGGVTYNLIGHPDTFEAIWEALKCLKDWRRMLLAGQKTDTKKKSSPDYSPPIPPEAWSAFNYQKQMKKDGRKCTQDQALDYAIGPHCRKGRDYLKKQMRRCETAKPPRKRRTKSGL